MYSILIFVMGVVTHTDIDCETVNGVCRGQQHAEDGNVPSSPTVICEAYSFPLSSAAVLPWMKSCSCTVLLAFEVVIHACATSHQNESASTVVDCTSYTIKTFMFQSSPFSL